MPMEEFATEVAMTKLLPEQDLVDIFIYFAVHPKPAIRFSTVPRSFLAGRQELVIKRFQCVEARWSYSHNLPDIIRYIFKLYM